MSASACPGGIPLEMTNAAMPWRVAPKSSLNRHGSPGGSEPAIVLQAAIGDTLQQGAPVADLHGGEVADAGVLGGRW
jgi:hypothetical protein